MDFTYLNNILSSDGDHLPNIGAQISELLNQINALKSDVRTIVEDDVIQFNPLLKENDLLKSKADSLLKEMSSVQQKIDGEVKNELSSCSNELKNMTFSYKEVDLYLSYLTQLSEINTGLNEAKQKMEEQEFFECAKLMTHIQQLVKNSSKDLKQVEIFKSLSQEVILRYEQLMHQISEIWSQCVIIDLIEEANTNSVQTKLSVDIKCQSELNKILKASNCLQSNLIEKRFGNKLLKNVLNKVILNKVKVKITVENEANLFLELLNSDKKPNYLEIFENIKIVIEFLKTHLDVELDDNNKFLSKVGSFIATEFADSLINNCLSETIPTSFEDLEKYKNIVENARLFEKVLQEVGFLPSDSSSLLDYAKNINVMFANKLCQSYLHKARNIMKKDLHNIIKPEAVTGDINVLPDKLKSILRNKLNIQDVFLLPECQISKQAEELMSLVCLMMVEIQKSLDLCAVRLFYTVRNIFEMYSAIVPLHHKKFLETLPQQAAIFHNNCIYFMHNLVHMVTVYYNKIPNVLKDHFTILLEEAIILRNLAKEKLEETVINQQNQLVSIVEDSSNFFCSKLTDFATLNENPKLDPSFEKSIRQCVRQLQLLQAVWNDVLPVNVYNRAIGFLLDALVEELIILVISVEDIPSQISSDLVSCFNIILERAPNLFPESKEIYRHVKKWQKFKEFVLLLKGSLKDIADRWANGMGPLAVEFTPEQIKHLIRALFQNSERRANLLAQIR